jgi:hypothetical protein
MRRLDRLWRALGQVPVLSGVRAFWDELAGPDAPVLQRYLRASPDLASTYPCPMPGADGCPRGVVVHGPDDIVAVCRARPRACETLALTRADVVAYELDLARLGVRLRTLLDLTGDAPHASEDVRVQYVGAYRPVAGYSFPVYLGLVGDAPSLASLVESLGRREARPFILLVPATDSVRAPAARGSIALGLDDITAVADGGDLALTQPAGALLAPFREAVLREAARDAGDRMVFFPTPAGAAWQDVRIRFRDGHTVWVSVLGQEGAFNYTQMGMVNRRNAEPTVQWQLLRDFAAARGTMTWRSPHADRKNQKRRENLARDLRSFFRIEGDPIALTDDRRGWRVCFELRGLE